jgi:hypothetical protein
MSSSDCREDTLDLNLVRSYLPLLVLMLRSALLVGATLLVAPLLSEGSVFAVLCVLVYFDALAFWRDALNRAAGFLLPTAFVLYMNQRGDGRWPADTRCLRAAQVIPYWGTDVAWAASSSVIFVSLCMRVPMRLRIMHVAVTWAGMALAHILLGCVRAMTPTELLSRLMLYYTSCAFFFLSSMVLPGLDRNAHSFTVVHVNLHVLFVELYVLVVSVSISAAAYACIFYQYHGSPAASAGEPSAAGASATGASGGTAHSLSSHSALSLHSANSAGSAHVAHGYNAGGAGEDRMGLHARLTPSAAPSAMTGRADASGAAGAICGASGPTPEDLLAELRAAKAAPRG